MNGPLAKKKSRNRHSSGNNSFQSTSVRFQPETDSRGMFPDAQTFQDFKKQRDMFYELVRIVCTMLFFCKHLSLVVNK